MTKIEALAKHLEVDPIMVDECKYDENAFSYRKAEFLVIHGDDLNDILAERITQDLWAFRAEFIAAHTKNGLSPETIEALEEMQREMGENCQPIVEALIVDLKAFIRDAVTTDGAGHFLASYDGKETVVDEFFIYRTN